MKNHTLFVCSFVFEKSAKLKLSSAINWSWRFMEKKNKRLVNDSKSNT